jgi:hypothetical protein
MSTRWLVLLVVAAGCNTGGSGSNGGALPDGGVLPDGGPLPDGGVLPDGMVTPDAAALPDPFRADGGGQCVAAPCGDGGACPAGQQCTFGEDSPAFAATCLTTCVSDDDCGPAMKCLRFFNSGGAQPQVCVGDGRPCVEPLESVACDTWPACLGDILLQEYAPPGVCAWEAIHCPLGCNPDAGPPICK